MVDMQRDKKEKQGEPKIPSEFLAPYNPATTEDAIYALWEDSGFFNPDVCVKEGITASDAEPFSIVLPPPNVTGTLHMGHAAMLAVEDILVRFHRMRGYKTLWIPGTDSAALATQAKVESDIYKAEKKTRHDLGRDELLKRIDSFVEESKTTILNQLRKMGSSLDWSRYAYTMDEKRYDAVMEAFVRMYDAGLIYRGDRIVNWDPKLQTTVSDDEIEYIEQTDPFYHFQYGPFEIGTVRPETKFGDKYVVMHPDDTRYKDYAHGDTIELEWIHGHITATIIKDVVADMAFGSGVMTITPAHSLVDFEIAQRHGLDIEPVIDDRGILLPIAQEFAGQHISKARAAIVEKLRSKGLIIKEEKGYVHNVATNSRGGGIIEPQIKRQWFVDVNKKVAFPDGKTQSLKGRMREAVESKQTQILPAHFEKTYYHWIDNLRDWCISRQIWFGHRIPAWYKGTEMHIRASSPGAGWEQDPDVLDTWFSSGLWTFSTLGWPADTADLQTYHPTSVLETGYDIIFFWVARMILMSGFLLGEVPFRNVYFHGLVRDSQGRKMSKSLGNIINPLDMIQKYGADATRLSLIIGATPGTDIKLSEDKVRGYKHFSNKLWNVSRFVLTVTALHTGEKPDTLSARDKEILSELNTVTAEITKDIQEYRLYMAAEKAYHYLWHTFADTVLEESKSVFADGEARAQSARAYTLVTCLITSLKLLHPFMPFVTETIWQKLPSHLKADEADMLMVAQWPTTPETSVSQ